MTENQNLNNIWSTIENTQPQKSYKKKFCKKTVKISQIDKEKTITQGQNAINEKSHSSKKLFINKKRGRRLKELNHISIAGTHDRFSDDNLKRKVKTHFHNYIIALLNTKFVVPTPNDKQLKFGKMKSSITQNITVEYNQHLFNRQIKDIIKEVSNKYQNKNINLDCINYAMSHPKENQELIKYLNMTYKDMYLNYYLKSTKKDFGNGDIDESYEVHKEKLQKFGEKYLENYEKNAEKLIDFYKACKKRKSRKKKEDQNLNGSSIDNPSPNKEINLYDENEENINNNMNILNIDEKENEVYLGENMISCSTQTETIQTDDESENEF